jgi:drug/metabolite transporter (DMT)-like permease
VGPYGGLLAPLVVAVLLLISYLTVSYKRFFTQDIVRGMELFPRRDVIVMAILDGLQLYLMMLGGRCTPPVLTVLFVHGVLPLVVVFGRLQPGRVHGPSQWTGAACVLLGILVALIATLYFSVHHRNKAVGAFSGCEIVYGQLTVLLVRGELRVGRIRCARQERPHSSIWGPVCPLLCHNCTRRWP